MFTRCMRTGPGIRGKHITTQRVINPFWFQVMDPYCNVETSCATSLCHPNPLDMHSSLLLGLIAGAFGSNDFGKQFLEKKRQEPGVVTLPSGLLYKVLREGDGESHPLADTQCKCHYEGRTAQEYSKEPKGKKFDSSYDRGDPTSFAPSGVIAGWTEAMQLMVEGDKWEM